jgi:hypothetical protein
MIIHLATTSTEQDGVNVLPFLVAIVVLAAAAVWVYLRRRRGGG